MQLTFKFNVDEVVQVKNLGIIGVVKMVAFDRGGQSYYITTSQGSEWWYEDQLEAKEE